MKRMKTMYGLFLASLFLAVSGCKPDNKIPAGFDERGDRLVGRITTKDLLWRGAKTEADFFYDKKGNIKKVEETLYMADEAVSFTSYEFRKSGRSLEVTATGRILVEDLNSVSLLKSPDMGNGIPGSPLLSSGNTYISHWRYELNADNCITEAYATALGATMARTYRYDANRLVEMSDESGNTAYTWTEENMTEVTTPYGTHRIEYAVTENKTNINMLALLLSGCEWSGSEMGGSYAQLFFYGGERSLNFPLRDVYGEMIDSYDYQYDDKGYPVRVEISRGSEKTEVSFRYI